MDAAAVAAPAGAHKGSASGPAGTTAVPPSTTTAAASPKRERRVVSASARRVSSAEREDSARLQELETDLQRLDPAEKDMTELYAACDSLECALRQRPLRGSRHRHAVLRAVFRMMDRKDPRLRLKLAKIVLLLESTGSSFTNACKLVFKVSRRECNDSVLAEEGLAGAPRSLCSLTWRTAHKSVCVGVLMGILEGSNPRRDTAALVYATGTAKNLCNTALLRGVFAAGGAPALLARLLASAADPAGWGDMSAHGGK